MRHLLRTSLAIALVVATGSSIAQNSPLSLTAPHAIRQLVGPNILNRMEAGEFMRLGVFASRSEQATSATATLGGHVVDLPFYRGPILDDLFQAAVPFEPDMVGPWTIEVRRGTETATTLAPGVPAAFALPLVQDIEADREGRLSWTWPDLAEARALGLSIVTTIMATQEDNYDEYVLNFGLRDHPIAAGEAGEHFEIAIPEGELEEGKLFQFRVILQFLDADGHIVAESLGFADRLYAPPG